MLQSLKEAVLTVNPAKHLLGKDETINLGYVLGKSTVPPLISKIQALQLCPPPSPNQQVRRFLGLAEYYCRFIPGFSFLVAPLADLLKNESPQKIQWIRASEEAFQILKAQLCREPILHSPDFTKEFF